MTLEEEAIQLSKAVLLLDIQTYEEEEEGQCAHFREIAMRAAKNIQKLAKEN